MTLLHTITCKITFFECAFRALKSAALPVLSFRMIVLCTGCVEGCCTCMHTYMDRHTYKHTGMCGFALTFQFNSIQLGKKMVSQSCHQSGSAHTRGNKRGSSQWMYLNKRRHLLDCFWKALTAFTIQLLACGGRVGNGFWSELPKLK